MYRVGQHPRTETVPQNRSLITEVLWLPFYFYRLVEPPGNPASSERSDLVGYYELFEIWWSLNIKGFIHDEKDFKFYSEFDGQPGKDTNVGERWSLVFVLVRRHAVAFWTSYFAAAQWIQIIIECTSLSHLLFKHPRHKEKINKPWYMSSSVLMVELWCVKCPLKSNYLHCQKWYNYKHE